MFWWGNFFSVTLHLSGSYKELYRQNICKNIKGIEKDIFICVQEDQWQHHFEANNYLPVKELLEEDLLQIIHEKEFLKLAVKFPLQQWDAMPVLLQECFREIIELLKG